MSQVEPSAAPCACRHWDRHKCYAARYPDAPGYAEDDYCECVCHDHVDEGEDDE